MKVSIIAIVAGGTGGHISPAIAIIEELIKQNIQILLFTLDKNINYPDIVSLQKNHKVSIVTYDAPKIPKSPLNLYSFIKKMLQSIHKITKQNKKLNIQACIGMGGYPSLPLLLWALIKQKPYYICEQNSYMGKVNRLMHSFAHNVFLSFPKKKYKQNEIFTGNPLRKIFIDFKPSSNLSKPSNQIKTILLIGGSQGANDLNELYLHSIQDPAFKSIKFTVSTGNNYYAKIKEKARNKDSIKKFIHNMPEQLKNHDLIITRSGSSSVFETHWSQKPVIFIPFPYATDNHQLHNCTYLKEKNVAKIIDIRPFQVNITLKQLKDIINSDFYMKACTLYKQHKEYLPLNAHTLISEYMIKSLN